MSEATITGFMDQLFAKGVTPEELFTALTVTAGLVAVVAIIGLIGWIINVVCRWRIFSKAGEKGWKAIIPFYNNYTQYKITWKPLFFWITLALTIVSPFFQGREGFIMILIYFVLSVANLVIIIKAFHKLSKAFGHGIGFTFGLIFLNLIFMLILAFGKSRYVLGTVEQRPVIEKVEQ